MYVLSCFSVSPEIIVSWTKQSINGKIPPKNPAQPLVVQAVLQDILCRLLHFAPGGTVHAEMPCACAGSVFCGLFAAERRRPASFGSADGSLLSALKVEEHAKD